MPKLSPESAAVLAAVRSFDRECREAEYTDTDRVWELLDNVKAALGSRSEAKRAEAVNILRNAFPSR